MKIQLSDHFTLRKLIRFVLPSIGMMIFVSIYGVVDGMFVSNFAGKTAFAAVNLVMPFVMILGSVGFMLGAGGSALVGKTLGEGDRERANRYFTMIVVTVIICGAISSTLGCVFIRQIAILLGADEFMLPDCVKYGRIVIAFNSTFMLQLTFQVFFVTAEKPKLGLFFTIAAGLTNIVLDAVFVVGFKMGVTGAAIATGISQCVGGGIPLLYFLRHNTSLLRIVATKIELRPLFLSCLNGASEMLSQISVSIIGMVYNFQLMKYAGENGVATYGVLMYVNFIFIATFIGYTIGSAPIISYHYGAKNNDELKNVLKKSLILMLLGGACLTALAELLAKPISMIFVGYDTQLRDMATHALRVYALAFILSGTNIFISSYFTALNNGLVSGTISVLRTLLFQLAAVLLLPLAFGLEGIWWAIIVAEICAFAISIIFLIANRKKYGY